jgi:hypothetical protein
MARRVALERSEQHDVDVTEDCPARQCWVLDPADRSHHRRPGLLLEWRKMGSGGWEGRLVYAAELRAGVWAAVHEWLPATLVVPA